MFTLVGKKRWGKHEREKGRWFEGQNKSRLFMWEIKGMTTELFNLKYDGHNCFMKRRIKSTNKYLTLKLV